MYLPPLFGSNSSMCECVQALVCIFVFLFNVVVKDFGGWRILQGNFVCGCKRNDMNHTYLLFDYFCEFFGKYFWNILEKVFNFF
jgi:hypothetical protein